MASGSDAESSSTASEPGDRESMMLSSNRKSFVATDLPSIPVQIKARRLSSLSTLDMNKGSSFRMKIAQTIQKSMSPQTGNVIYGEDEISLPGTGIAIRKSRITSWQVALSLTLLITATIIFIVIIAEDNGGVDKFTMALMTSDAVMLGITIVLFCLPMGVLIIGVTSFVCKHQERNNLFRATNPNDLNSGNDLV